MSQNDTGLIDEYKGACSNMRTYINMRFAQLTIFLAITGLLINEYVKDVSTASPLKTAFQIGGLIVGLIFWLMEERSSDFFHHYRKRAIELEVPLGFEQYFCYSALMA